MNNHSQESILNRERQFLDRVYRTYNVCSSPCENAMRDLLLRTFSPYLRRGHALELGCSDGLMTEMISKHVDHLDVVDGCRHFICEASKRRLDNVRFIYSLFEEFETTDTYESIFGCYILEHVLEPVPLLKRIRNLLKPDGYLFVVVPNSRALSRQLALHMDILADLKQLTSNDLNHGHRRVYDRVSLNRDLKEAGFETIHEGGLMLKILADFQLDKLLHDEVLNTRHIEALYRMGLEYPDLCGSLFSVCRANR